MLAILIHGDAAFPGQGVVAETLNLSRLEGYDVGGIIHIIANNQLGFTTDPEESFSTSYASGLARGFKIPITHVNADDPVACIEAARLAIAYRQRFKLDYLIDLVGYRKYGHNEGDEPAFTQPQIYQIVAAHPTRAREVREGRWSSPAPITQEQADALVQSRMEELEGAYASVKPEQDYIPPVPEVPPSGAAKKARTAVAFDTLKAINAALMTVPEGFTVHRKLERGRERRKAMFASPSERSIDWAAAEELAMATILADGVPIRFTGEDVERGTFSHRHGVYHDAVTGEEHIPLQRAAAGEGVVRDPQQPAVRIRVRRLRARLQPAGAGAAGAVGSAIRRLHQRRADHPRRVHDLGPREVGHGAVAGAAAPPRLRRPGPRSFERAPRALPQRRRRHQHAHRQLHDGGAVFPPAAPAGAAAQDRSAAARRHDAEEPAAASVHGVDAARSSPKARSTR